MAERVIIEQKPHKTVYREGGRLIKEYAPSFPKAAVYNEAYIQCCAEEAGVPVPKIHGVYASGGGWALEMDYIEGKNIQQLMDEAGAAEQTVNPRVEEYLEKLVDIQLEVCAHRAPSLRNTRYKLEEIINSVKEIDVSTRYELLQRIHGMKRHTKLCHGNFVPSNVILREDGSYVVLDWADATSGNAGADAATSYMRLCLAQPEAAFPYLKIYSRKADFPIQYIQQWMPIVAAARLAKHIESERPLLESWISVAEYQ